MSTATLPATVRYFDKKLRHHLHINTLGVCWQLWGTKHLMEIMDETENALLHNLS